MMSGEGVQHERWYQGYHTSGDPHKVFERLSVYLMNQGFSAQVPSLRAEKRAKAGPFYFFVGLDTEIFGQMPEALQDALERFPNCRSPVQEPYTLEQIKSFVSGELEVEHLGAKVGLHHLIELEALEDPLNFADLDEHALDVAPDPAWEKLLYWLSSVGSGSWAAFAGACGALGFASARWAWRALSLLGHLEVSFEARRWRMLPAYAVQVAPGAWVLCGQRSPAMQDALEVERGAQGRWAVHSLERWERFGGLSLERPAETLLHRLPDRATWQRSLHRPRGLKYASLRRYHAGEFRKHSGTLERGFYQLFAAGAAEPAHSLLWDDEAACWRQGEWYGLRFLSSERPWVRFDPQRLTLAVAQEHRLPTLYERPLVLASGRLPRSHEGYWIFEGLGTPAVQRLAELLSLELRLEDSPDLEDRHV